MRRRFFLAIIYLVLSCGAAIAAPQDINPSVFLPAGSLNTHDMDTLRKFEMEKQEQKDFEQYKDNNMQKESVKKKKKIKAKVEKANINEYATKGVYVENIEVSPSEILTEEEIKSIIEEYTQTNITFEQLQEIANRINKLYLDKGYVTARAYIPQQTIENETVKIELLEGRVGDITITGNRWTRTKYIKDRIDSQKDSIFNVIKLEQNMTLFNRYNYGIDLTGNLNPGAKKLGTTDIELVAHEKSPFHLTALMDNAGRETIGKYRAGLMLQDDSLFGMRDKLTLGAYASRYSVTPFADYNIPVNKKDGRIGFSFSSSNSKIGYGDYRIFNIKSRSQNYSIYFNQPIIQKSHMELSSITSLDYKQATTSFDGHDLYTDKIPSAKTGLNFRYDTKRGIWYLNQSVAYAAPLFQKDINYVKIEGGILRLHDFGHGIVGQLRGNYQVIPKDVVPYADQFVAGGVATVRGYSEGLLIGRSGYIMNAELLFPIAPRTRVDKKTNKTKNFIGNYLKGFVFCDHAMVFPYKGNGTGSEGYNKDDVLLSIGLGTRINLPGDLSIRLSWGFPLMKNKYEVRQSWGRFHIEMSLSPDFDAIVRLRRPKNIEKVKIDDNIKFVNNNKKENISTLPPKRTVIKSLSQKT